MLSENARIVLEKRYLKKNKSGEVVETAEDMFKRVAHTISSSETNYGVKPSEMREIEDKFYEIISKGEFLPNSPTLMNAGRKLGQLSACFVLPVDDSMESIFEGVKNTALIHQSGGGTGFSFSRLRPSGDMVKSTMGVSSGPVSFIEVYNAATEAIKQGGTRRGANMGILRVDHPDIEKFISSKEKEFKLNNFNISVAVTDEFMKAVEEDGEYNLINPRNGKISGSIKAKPIFDMMVHLAWKNGEPGIIFVDEINRHNPTPEVGMIESTNPCGEQPLLPYESCNLGSIVLSRMVKTSGGKVEVDWNHLSEVIKLAVRFLDDVIEANKFPLKMIEEMTLANRKIGLGVMGFADLLFMLGIPYNSQEALDFGGKLMEFIQTESHKASEELAEDRGTFPNFHKSIFADREPIRNATVTTIAPTGTIGIIAGASSGIEPVFSLSFTRKNVLDNNEMIEVNPVFEKVAKERGFYSEEMLKDISKTGTIKHREDIPEDVKKIFVTAHDITPIWHIKMQAAFQKYTDNAVSKTVNFHNNAKVEDVAEVYLLAYKLGCKGVTVYRDGSRSKQVLNLEKEKTGDNGKPVGTSPRPRPAACLGTTEKIKTGCGNLYVIINQDEQGLNEVFSQMGKSGGCAASQSEAVSRLISLALRSGIKPHELIKQLKGIRCPSPAWGNGGSVLSCPDAIAQAIEHRINSNTETQTKKNNNTLVGICPECPECGNILSMVEGCIVCRGCGYSKC